MDMSLVRGSVVVGVDGSEASAAAVDWAARFAVREARTLSVVHACGLPGRMPDLADVLDCERGLLSVGGRLAEDAVVEARLTEPDVRVRSLVVLGSAGNALVEASETATVVVVGARGRGAVARALLGSVSDQVARESCCPVVVVRDRAMSSGRPVVVGVDGTPASTAAVEFAFHRAAVRSVPLHVLHASWGVRGRASAGVELTGYARRITLSAEQERFVAELVAGLSEKYPEVTVTEVYRRGDAVGELVAASRDASLVVVGARGRRRSVSSVLGSVSRAVAERAECPVVVARP